MDAPDSNGYAVRSLICKKVMIFWEKQQPSSQALPTTDGRFELMATEEGELRAHPHAHLLGVSRSGFYAWSARQAEHPCPQRRGSDLLDAKVLTVFAESDKVYAAPRVHAQPAREGTAVDVKTVAESMAHRGLRGHQPEEVLPGAHVALRRRPRNL